MIEFDACFEWFRRTRNGKNSERKAHDNVGARCMRPLKNGRTQCAPTAEHEDNRFD